MASFQKQRRLRANARLAERDIIALGRTLEPKMARAFADAVKDIKNAASVRAIARAIQEGRLDEALKLVGVDEIAARMRGSGMMPGAPTVVDRLITAFREGGASGARQLPPRVALRATLDFTNPQAIRYLTEHIPTLIREISEESARAVQTALLRGFNEGRAPIQIAREIRGVVGLTEAQAQSVMNFRRQLETGEVGTSTPPGQRRLSAPERSQARSIVRQGGQTGQRVEQLVSRYEQSLINRRARNIARTEVTRASGAGQTELWRQAAEQGLIDPTKTRRFWIVTADEKLRKLHRPIPKMNPEGVRLDEPFQTPIGSVMHPRESGDPAFDINCRCTEALGFEE